MSFNSHKLNEEGFKSLTILKSSIAHLRDTYKLMGKEGRDLSLALTKLEESSFWATKAMASKESNHSEVTEY